MIESVKQWKSEVGDCDWICRYYDDILGRLEAGKSVTEAEEDMRFKCINAITRIKAPVWERVLVQRFLMIQRNLKNAIDKRWYQF